MKTLKELINKEALGWAAVKKLMMNSKNAVQVLPRSPKRADEELLRLQISTKSPVGAIVFETGGILVDDGWLRILGSGSMKLNRGMMEWNKGKSYINEGEKGGFLLVAEDVIGGYFAINAGELGDEIGKIYFFAPNTLRWESLECGYSEFINWAFNGDLSLFYEAYKWDTWKEDVTAIDGNQVYSLMLSGISQDELIKSAASKKVVSVQEQILSALKALDS